ncbi:hypothetical protein C8Q75DRAFT_802431 [Abortiporus biennis]|nr:hypothetical protein C8Q75DRAFT_802431 [Abortiporus biennis]
MHCRSSSQSKPHLHQHPEEPPVPSSLVGSPPRQKFTTTSLSLPTHPQAARSDGDESGKGRKDAAHLQVIPPPSPLLAPTRTPKLTRNGHVPAQQRVDSPSPIIHLVSSPAVHNLSPLSTPTMQKQKSAASRHVRNNSQNNIPNLVLSSAFDGTFSPEEQKCVSSFTGGVTCFEFISLHNRNSSRRVAT